MDFLKNNITYVFLALVGLVAMSSKGIILYNEEILVALAFVSFVSFCVTNYSSTVAESLDDRANSIQEELQTYLTLKESYLRSLIDTHKKQVDLSAVILSLNSFSSSCLVEHTAQRESELERNVTNQVSSQLKSLAALGSGMRSGVYTKLASSLRTCVLESLQRAKKSKQDLKPKVLKEAIQKLATYN